MPSAQERQAAQSLFERALAALWDYEDAAASESRFRAHLGHLGQLAGASAPELSARQRARRRPLL